MTEQIIIKGYWWLPSSPNDTVAGILTYTPGQCIELELIGQLKPCLSALEEYIGRTDENVIFGVSSDAKEISLINCYTSGGSFNFNCPFPIQRYNCQHLVIGSHVACLDTDCFFEAQINIPYLSLWATPNSISKSISLNKKQIQKINISFIAGENNIAAFDFENYKFSIDGAVNYRGDYFEPHISQKTYLTITSEDDCSLSDILSKIFLFEQFISFATLKHVESYKIVLFDKSKFQQLDNGKKFYFPIEYIRVFHGREDLATEQDPHKRGDFLFTYDTIKSEFNKILTKWYSEQRDIAPIRHHLIECVRKKKTFSSVDFLIVIQGIEGFWWRFRDEDYKRGNQINHKKQTRLKTILATLIQEFEDIKALKLCDINIDDVVDSRNYYSHFVKKESKPHVKDGIELYELTDQIRKLLICCILNFIGFSNEQIAHIVKESHSSYLHD